MIDNLKSRLEILKDMIVEYGPDKETKIKDEIKNLYIEISNALKSLTQAQDELRQIAQNFKQKKSSKTEVEKFYSFVRSRTSAELDIATLLDRAWNLIAVEDYDEAIKAINQVLEIEPKNVKGLGLMGLTLMNKGLYDQAMMFFQQVILEDPDNPFALNNLGYICYKKGIWGEAIEHLTKAAKQQKDRMAMLYANFYLGLVYYERSMLNDAIKFFDYALKLGPNLQEAYYYMGLAETRRYEFKKALEYFEKCQKVDPESKYARLSRDEIKVIKPLVDPKMINKRDHQDEPDREGK
jgi:tetratricopeptide (TPR) repeat protein